MKKFSYIEEVEEWLEPMDYKGFWYAVAPYHLTLLGHDKVHCDHCIAVEGVAESEMLKLVKWLARLEMTERYQLEHRPLTPWVQLVQA